MEVDVAAFKLLAMNTPPHAGAIPIYPCTDFVHTPDGYDLDRQSLGTRRNAAENGLPQQADHAALVRGIMASWLEQGADGVATFNATFSFPPGHLQQDWGLYAEIGSAEAMVGKDKIYAIGRRGGVSHFTGYRRTQ